MSVEPRRIKKLVRETPRLTSKEVTEIANGLPEASIQEETRKAGAKKKVYRTRKVSEGHVYALTKPRSVEGYVTLTQLASERGIQPQLARIWAKKAGWTPTADGWRFKEGSRDLKRIRKVLGLEP
jgi:hypothetical protein